MSYLENLTSASCKPLLDVTINDVMLTLSVVKTVMMMMMMVVMMAVCLSV